MAIAHEGHQGIVKTKQLLREKIWFPQIDEEVKELVGNCLVCQANGPTSHPDPLQMSPVPPEPWHGFLWSIPHGRIFARRHRRIFSGFLKWTSFIQRQQNQPQKNWNEFSPLKSSEE